MLTVCTSSTDGTYCTCADVMNILFNSTSTAAVGTTQEIDQIGRLIARASRWADQFVGRHLAMQVYSETLAGAGGRTLTLSQYPLARVLRFFDSTATCEATAICSSDYRVEDYDSATLSRDAGWRWTAALISAETCFELGLTPSFRSGERSHPWLAEYAAGYKLAASTSTCHGLSTGDDTWTTGATLPDDVVQAVAMRAAEMYSNPLGVASRSVGNLSVSYRIAGARSASEAALERYRKVD